MTERNDRLGKYDLLRVVCMISIIVYHYTRRYDELFGHTTYIIKVPSELATIAVSIFLLLAGYFSYTSLKKCNSVVNYAKKRFLRLVPVFWIACTTTALVFLISGFQKITLVQYVSNMLFVNRFFGIPFIDGAYWYMIVLIVYTVLSLAYIFCARHKIQVFDIYILAMIAAGILNYFVSIVPDVIGFLLFQYVNKCVIGFYIKEESNYKGYSIIRIILLLISEAFWVDFTMMICDLMGVLLLYVVNKCSFSFIKGSILKCISTIASASYFVYLLHQQLGYFMINTLEKNGVNSVSSIILACFMITVIIVVYKSITGLIKKFVSQTRDT